MKALILNSGLGKRMGSLTHHFPKCMTEIQGDETILSRQLKSLVNVGIRNVIITTGYFNDILSDYVSSLNLPLCVEYVNNPLYAQTNYIYSIYLARISLQDDLILMHGDLVYDQAILQEIIESKDSLMCVSSSLALPEKDFKAVIEEGRIVQVGINCFDQAMAAQPLYKLKLKDWLPWLNEINCFCEEDHTSVYAEDAFNQISRSIALFPYDVKDRLCGEIDNPTDLKNIREKIERGTL